MGHMIQYAYVGSFFVGHTENMTDAEVIGRAYGNDLPVVRFDRCPICEVWTRVNGVLRREIDCPAVRAALVSERGGAECDC